MTTKTSAPRKPRAAPADAPLAVEMVPIDRIRPAAVNDEIYKQVRADDPSVVALAQSVRAHGVLDRGRYDAEVAAEATDAATIAACGARCRAILGTAVAD